MAIVVRGTTGPSSRLCAPVWALSAAYSDGDHGELRPAIFVVKTGFFNHPIFHRRVNNVRWFHRRGGDRHADLKTTRPGRSLMRTRQPSKTGSSD